MFKVILVNHFLEESDISEIAGISRDVESKPSCSSLLQWGHLSPFEFARVLFYAETPIFVSRQLFRHRTANYMERSLRYAEAQEVFIPEEMKHNPDVVKLVADLSLTYDSLLEAGVHKERARLILPLGTMTKFYVEYDLRNFIHLCKVRITPETQKETRMVVEKMLESIKDVHPSVYTHIVEAI